jgi:hypothetical protein
MACAADRKLKCYYYLFVGYAKWRRQARNERKIKMRSMKSEKQERYDRLTRFRCIHSFSILHINWNSFTICRLRIGDGGKNFNFDERLA